MRRSKFVGVYSLPAERAAKHRKTYYFVWELPGGAYAVQELNSAFQPIAEAEFVDNRSFLNVFTAETAVLAAPVIMPDLSFLEALSLRQKGNPLPDSAPPIPTAPSTTLGDNGHASPQYGKTIADMRRTRQSRTPAPAPTSPPVAKQQAVDLEATRKAYILESRLRETFRQTLLRLKRPRERKAALLALEQLAGTTQGIVPAHKHMFRDFGVRLRQSKLVTQAVLCTRRVVELAPEDDHARFNLARLLCILGKYDEAIVHIRAAISMDKKEPVYEKLLTYILEEQQKHSVPRAAQHK